jgi:putative addiction module component (TIGR02574 family)
MTQDVEQLLQSALALSETEQLQLLSALMSAVDERGLRPFDDAWLTEINRRSDEFAAGTVESISWPDVKERAKQELLRRAEG